MTGAIICPYNGTASASKKMQGMCAFTKGLCLNGVLSRNLKQDKNIRKGVLR